MKYCVSNHGGGVAAGLLLGAALAFMNGLPGVELSAAVLFDFSGDFDLATVQATDARVSRSPSGTLKVDTSTNHPYPGITLKAAGGKFDLSRFQSVVVDLRNAGADRLTVSCRVDNPGADGRKNCTSSRIDLEPGQKASLIVNLSTTPWRLSEPMELIGMRGAPGQGENLEAGNVTQMLLFVGKPAERHSFEVSQIRAAGTATVIDARRFLPFIDEFGQFIHADWPGKTRSQDEFARRQKAEEQELAVMAGPAGRNQSGGWSSGPKLEATGFFRVEKLQGKWWLVDPEGCLFWSHGIDCVRSESATPIGDRENYYRNLPAVGTPLGAFYGSGRFAAHGYYEKKSNYRTYDFAQANQLRKYGSEHFQAFADVTHRRLRSWGMNTIANWSDGRITAMRRTPYVGTINFRSKPLEGSKGYWGKFPDVFDPEFAAAARQAIERQKGAAVGDRWCIGLFVHNELGWGDDTSLAVAALTSPADQAAKQAFLADLKGKYQTIDALNDAWAAKYPTWEALAASTNSPNVKRAGPDLRAFYSKFAETYFRVIRAELKRLAPQQLYFGCRFAWVNDLAALAATKYCDVVSYNRYAYSVADQKLPNNVDLPIIIGEFHFGALDRGMFHTGLRSTTSQEDRARKYQEYVQGALRNPQIVGTHWFQYKDQATTGRSDGENYQIGFLDICDSPYPEIIQASREVGYSMYEYRRGN